MLPEQYTKMSIVTAPAAKIDNTSASTTEIDTKGYDYAQFLVVVGDMTADLTALAITESDSSGTGHSNVTGAVFGTSTNSAGSTSSLPAATDDNKIFIVDLALTGRKRYLDVTCTVGTGSSADGDYITILCRLSRAEETPNTASERGVTQLLRVPAY